jgi:SAM-dependent methyltransferase
VEPIPNREPWRAWKRLSRGLRDAWLKAVDARRLDEIRGERVVFRHLLASGLLASAAGGRILEIGPKHGEDTALIASLNPRDLVVIDLPEKTEMIRRWIPSVSRPMKHVEGNLLYLRPEELAALGTFDLVWCLGVLYHNVEQLRLLRTLFRLTAVGGRVVVESATTRDPRLHEENVVEIHWPRTYRDLATITHLPSRRAIQSWMEMVGFSAVTLLDVYSRELAWQRAVVTGLRAEDARPCLGYSSTGGNPEYVIGEAE